MNLHFFSQLLKYIFTETNAMFTLVQQEKMPMPNTYVLLTHAESQIS